MDNELLQKFQADFNVKDAVKDYLVKFLEEEAIFRAFTGKDVVGIKEANDVISKAFNSLDSSFTETKRIQRVNK